MNQVISVQARSPQAPTLIVMWSGTAGDIPSGWLLCDGTDGRPDLRDRFVQGAAGEVDPEGRTLGQGTNTVSHSHRLVVADESGHQHVLSENCLSDEVAGSSIAGGGASLGRHSHTWAGAVTAGGSAHDHTGPYLGSSPEVEVDQRPPWYALCYLIGKGDVPVGAIALMYIQGDPYDNPTLVPPGYHLCDGEDGTPELYGAYVLCADGATYFPGAFYGGSGLVVADHAHDLGAIALTASTHQHEGGAGAGPGNDTWSSFSTEMPTQTVMFGTGDVSDAIAGPSHRHRLSSDHENWRTEDDGLHGHELAVREETATDITGGGTEPPSYLLHWVMRYA